MLRLHRQLGLRAAMAVSSLANVATNSRQTVAARFSTSSSSGRRPDEAAVGAASSPHTTPAPLTPADAPSSPPTLAHASSASAAGDISQQAATKPVVADDSASSGTTGATAGVAATSSELPSSSFSSAVPSAPPSTAAAADSGNITVSLSSTPDALSKAELAYCGVAKQLDLCSLDDFIKGSKQAYTAAGVLLHWMHYHDWEPSTALVSLEEQHRETASFTLEPKTHPRPMQKSSSPCDAHEDVAASGSSKIDAALAAAATPSSSSSTADNAIARALAAPRPQVLGDFATKDFLQWVREEGNMMNPFSVSHPKDLVVSATVVDLLLFNRSLPVIKANSTSAVADENWLQKIAAGIQAVDLSAADAASKSSSTTSAGNGSGGESTSPSQESIDRMRFLSPSEELAEKRDRYLRQNGLRVLVELEAIVPPERFSKNFQFFYERLDDCASEQQRRNASFVYSVSRAYPVLRALDFIHRVLSNGKKLKLTAEALPLHLLGLTPNVLDHPLRMKKVLEMELSATMQWRIHSITNHSCTDGAPPSGSGDENGGGTSD